MTFVVIGTIAIVVVVVAIGVVVDRKIAILPKPQELKEMANPKRPARYGAGEAPSTAIRARGPQQLDKLRASRRCSSCREQLVPGDDDERVRYGDGELLVMHLRCPKCGETRSLYVDGP